MGTCRRQGGFSLIEILVAVTIMGLAYVAILENFSMSSRRIAAMEEDRTAIMDHALDFDAALLSMDQGDQKTGQKGGAEGEILGEGATYQLIQLSDEGDDFMTLQLKKK